MLNVRLAALALLMSLMANATAYGQSTPAETRRVALVIGNGSYPQSPVASVPGDARAVADVLREGGFDVVYAENATRTEMEAAIGAFTKKLGWGTTAMVYFGGHAVRYQDRNFLLAIDSRIATEADVRAQGIDIDLILDPLIVSRPAGCVVILDAARKNPWQQAISPRLRGLASQPPISGVTVVYPMAPGEVVGDTPREANLFAVELVKSAKVQGLPFKEVLRRVRTSVAQATRDRQMVWESAPAPESSSSVRCASRFAPPIRWNTASGRRSRAATVRLISRPILNPYPDGPFAVAARARLQQIEARNQPRSTSPTPPPAAPPPAARHSNLPSATVRNVPKLS